MGMATSFFGSASRILESTHNDIMKSATESRVASFAMRNAGIGAGLGAVNGLFSDDSSVVGGAVSGAMTGAAIGAGLGLALNKSQWFREAAGNTTEGIRSWLGARGTPKSGYEQAIDIQEAMKKGV